MSERNTVQVPQLTRQLAQSAAVAIRRIRELTGCAIHTHDTETELATAKQYVQTILTQHADEFIGTYLAMENEYSPLVQGLAGLLRRAHIQNEQIAQRLNAMLEAKQAAKGSGAGLIIPDSKPDDCGKSSEAPVVGSNVIQGSFSEATQAGAPVTP